MLRGENLRHFGIRNTQFDIEYADERDLLRVNTYARRRGVAFRNVRFPTCVGSWSDMQPLKKREFERANRMLSLLNDLSYKNQIFSYDFRNVSCVYAGACAFPEPGAAYESVFLAKCVVSPILRGILVLIIIAISSGTIQYVIVRLQTTK